MIGRLNHVAIAVKDLAKSAAMYRDTLGAEGFRAAARAQPWRDGRLRRIAEHKGQLLEPLGENSPIAKFLEKNPDGGCITSATRSRTSSPPAIISRPRARACSATQSERSARTASPCCSCIPRISSGTLVEIEQV